MNRTRLLPLIFLLMMIGSAVAGQSRFRTKGDKFFERLAYAEATRWYHRAHKKDPLDHNVIRQLAECYRLTKNYSEASDWYGQYMNTPAVKDSISYFWYGHCLLKDKQYDAAKDAFQQYSFLAPNDPRGKSYVEALENIQKLLESKGFIEVKNLPVNGPASDFGAVPYGGGIIFASSRDEGPPVGQSFDWLNDPFLSFFHAEQKTEEPPTFDRPKLLKGDVNSKYHESSFTYANDDSTRVYFTRNNYIERKKGMNEDKVILLKIYTAVMDGLEPTYIQEFPYNSEDYSVTHPCLSKDGTELYFTSDMPDGVGGKDLYKCVKSGTGWGPPENLGPEINTPGDEQFPFIASDGSLFFSSDGHPGLGYLDVFWAREKKGKLVIQNMGPPLNSPYDDFAVWLDENGENGYFSSDRPGGKGNDDIYQIKIQRPEVEIIVVDSIASLPIEGAEITVHDRVFDTYETFKTDSSGVIEFKSEFGTDYEILVKTTEFSDRVEGVNTEIDESVDTLQMLYSKRIELYNPPPAISAIVIDEESRKRLVGATVEFIKLIDKDTTFRYTDRNGRFAIALETNTYYKVNVKKPGYLSYTNRVSTSNIAYDGDTVIPLRLEQIKLNRIIKLEGIRYDFDKYKIREDMKPKLFDLVDLLKENPEIRVELSSHTDARGSYLYNQRLSQKRAQAAKDYVVSQGVDPTRIDAVGYGEMRLVNRCKDGIRCAEEEHYQNRRTEYKIIGFIDDIDPSDSILDTRKNPKELVPYEPEKKP